MNYWIYIAVAVVLVGLIVWMFMKKKKDGGQAPPEPPSTPPGTPGM